MPALANSKSHRHLACLALACAALLLVPAAQGQGAITNVRAAQRAGTNLVDIDYDVTGTTLPLKISLEVSADDGTTYNIPASALTGAAGSNVTPATNLRLTWDAGKDWGGRFSTTMRYKVVADDDPPPEGFAMIPTGPFQMGDSFGEGSGSDEVPVHTVQVNAFYMAKYLVTKAMWDEVRAWGAVHGYTDLSAGTGKVATHPVQSITWNDILKWCNARSEKDGLTPCYMVSEVVYRTGQSDAVVCNWSASGYRLPTETEWEKAARGGLSGKRFPWGDTITHSEANFWNGGGEFYQSGSTAFHPTYDDGVYPYTSPVGSFAPNGFGLYDMVGNVYEWCWDWYGSYPSTSPADPRGAASGSFRVGRGGCWRNGAFYCRSAFRGRFNPGDSGISLGCRIARSSVP
jgi:formylglycine-generating enzyme required for sulfatase activity